MASRNQGPILIVEDGDEDYDMLRLAFERSGVSNPVYRCVDGDEALDFLAGRGAFARSGPACRPSIIVLDLNLAGTDGREVLRELKQSPDLRAIPVMILSTSNNPRDVAGCYQEGANCYALKPVGLEKFEKLVDLFKEFWLDFMELPPGEGGEDAWR